MFAFLCGNTNVFWCLSVGTGVFWIALEWFERRQRRTGDWKRAASLLALAGVLTIGLTAFAWLPYLDLVEHSNRSEPAYEFAAFGSATWSSLLTHLTIPVGPYIPNWERNFFIGTFWTFAGIMAVARCRTPPMKAIAVLLLFAILYSLGENGPLHRICYAILPGTDIFRVPPRMMIWPSVLLCVAAAVWLSRSQSIDRNTVLILFGLALFLVLFTTDPRSDTVRRGLAGGIMCLAAGSLLWFTRDDFPRSSGITSVIVGLVLICEFAPHLAIQRIAVAPPDESVQRQETGRRHLAELAAHPLPTSSPAPIRIKLHPGSIPGNGGIPFRLADVNGNTPLYLDRPWRFLHEILGIQPPKEINSTLHKDIGTADPRRLPFLSIDAVPDRQRGGFQTPPNNWPRAWFSSAVERAESEDAIAKIASGFPAHHITLTEQAPPFPIATQPPIPVQAVNIESFELNRIVVSLTNQHAGYLVLNEAWFPGWSAVSGEYKVDAEPVNVWMRAFPLPPGSHRMEITFRPRNWATGIWISLATLVACLWIFFRTSGVRSSTGEPGYEPSWQPVPMLTA